VPDDDALRGPGMEPGGAGPAGPGGTEWQRRARLAAEALARAKADARARGQRVLPSHRDAGPGEGADQGPGAARVRRSGREGRPVRRRRDDPQPLGAAIDGLLADHGWRTAAAVGSVFGRWDQIVGPGLAAHTRPERFTDGELVVTADSTAWATQLRYLASKLVRRLNEELGDGTVRRVIVRGPAPPRQPGPLRVRGSRSGKGDYG
jgi:predicted nucleic acid-binding Zn ribbon protein